jgi:ribose/xylose/arabinose/galactoside ABC-type transport system permease subunit
MSSNSATLTPSANNSVGRILTKYGLAFVLLIIMVIFGILEPKFFGYKNLLNILSSSSITAIAGMGFVVIMSSGEIDFSIGIEFALSGIFMMMVVEFSGLGFWFGIIVLLILLTTFGLINAFLNIKIGIPAFLATMGTSLILQYVATTLTGGYPIQYFDLPDIFYFWGQYRLFGVIPFPIVIFVVVAIVMIIYTDRTKSGKQMYAVGANPAACDYVGINFRKEKLKGFLICAILAGLAGFINTSLYNKGNPTEGSALLLSCITALMLGATFIKPGVFNIPGTIIGAILVTVIANGLLMVSAPSYLKDFVMGTVLFTAVVIITIIRKNSEKVGSG